MFGKAKKSDTNTPNHATGACMHVSSCLCMSLSIYIYIYASVYMRLLIVVLVLCNTKNNYKRPTEKSQLARAVAIPFITSKAIQASGELGAALGQIGVVSLGLEGFEIFFANRHDVTLLACVVLLLLCVCLNA